MALFTAISYKFTNNAGLMSIKLLCNLSLVMSCFGKDVNQISFGLAEMIEVHAQLALADQEALVAKHSQPPKHQLIRVVELV